MTFLGRDSQGNFRNKKLANRSDRSGSRDDPEQIGEAVEIGVEINSKSPAHDHGGNSAHENREGEEAPPFGVGIVSSDVVRLQWHRHGEDSDAKSNSRDKDRFGFGSCDSDGESDATDEADRS